MVPNNVLHHFRHGVNHKSNPPPSLQLQLEADRLTSFIIQVQVQILSQCHRDDTLKFPSPVQPDLFCYKRVFIGHKLLYASLPQEIIDSKNKEEH